MKNTISTLRKALDALPVLDAHRQKQRDRAFAVDFICSSSQIAGNMVSREETERAMYGRILEHGSPIPLQLELQHYYRAYENMREFLKTGWYLGAQEIEELHKTMTIIPENKGAYRREWEMEFMCAGSAREQLYALADRYNNDWRSAHTVKRATLFHLRFYCILPFCGMNMRLARILLNFHLMREGFPPINIPYLETQAYHNALDEYREYGESRPMYRFITRLVRAALEEEIKARQNAQSALPVAKGVDGAWK